MLSLPPLYGIVNYTGQGDPIRYALRLAHAGVGIIQLRAKGISAAELTLIAREIKLHFDALLPPPIFLINDHPEVCLEVGADGVHLGQKDGSPAAARELLGKDAIIGRSTHTLTQVAEAVRESVDYIGFGPIFPTTTKPGENQVTGVVQLRDAVKRATVPVVAIGGINVENAAEVYSAGVDAVAVISDLERAPDVTARVHQYEQLFLRRGKSGAERAVTHEAMT
jgi:thiamine-phosphate pyrophosphorylase